MFELALIGSHTIADRNSPTGDSDHRPLAKEGIDKAHECGRIMGEYLLRTLGPHKISTMEVYSGPTERTKHTAEIISSEIGNVTGIELPVEIRKELYDMNDRDTEENNVRRVDGFFNYILTRGSTLSLTHRGPAGFMSRKYGHDLKFDNCGVAAFKPDDITDKSHSNKIINSCKTLYVCERVY